MEKRDESQKMISNKAVNWALHYDFYEVEFRDKYRKNSLQQNASHFTMLKNKGAAFLGNDKTFCEIGFSCGLTLRHVFKYFGKIYGLDISPKNVELTEKELKSEGYSGFELYTSDLTVFDKRFENKFDVISFIHGLEHFSSEDYPVVFENIKRYLKPKGVFTGALPYNNQFNYRMCPECNTVFEIDGHVSSHNTYSLTKLFEENGFEIIHLDNFNVKYALKQGGILKKIYKYFFYGMLRKQSKEQLEYIVRPN